MDDKATTPPGWYPHPSMPGSLGYWDGAKWTEHVAPAHALVPAQKSGVSVWVIAAGVLLAAVVIWIVYAVATADDDLADVANGQSPLSGGTGDASSFVVN